MRFDGDGTPDWDEYLMAIAQVVATKSKDPSVKVGAVIVGLEHEIRTTGYNGFPREVVDVPARWNDRQTKYPLVEHAERNAIYNAARVGIPLHGCTAYVTAPPCSECARAVIQAGLREVITPKDHPFKGRTDWAESFKTAQLMFDEAGVYVRYL